MHFLKDNPALVFHPVISKWFEETFASPTPPQQSGWPPIFRGEHTLILAPTGSGKTLAAFLVCIHRLLEKLMAEGNTNRVHTLYISPLKALNYDIERNLEEPLRGIQKKASEMGVELPEIRVAVRTGDTTQKERERMIRQAPHILITTPESLHLILTSVRASRMLQSVQFVIIDEIHALSENKRGTFLSLLLERIQPNAFVRIGLSATQKPLKEVAKFLGGYESDRTNYKPRAVTIVDTGMRKELEIQVISPVQDFRMLPEDTVWPDIYKKLLELVQAHHTTLIFANNRAAVERITAEINERAGYDLARAHHGSVSKAKRREIEEQLKRGEIPALVATATLELGIDMGAIDLVCQVESPKSVTRGLQRVGRAGHLYKSTSKGRFIPKTRADLLEIAVISRAMMSADVSPINIPRNCLDILAQQIVAMVALKTWQVDDLFHLVRQACPYQQLPYEHYLNVLEMLSGRYPSTAFRDLKPRLSWDRVNQLLYALPGTHHLAIMGGGAIPDTGQYGCYLEDGTTKIGELEEEFIYERRLGEVFVLGTSTWRIKEITHDRVIVSPAPGEPARMPFWKGEYANRNFHLGKLYGQFCRELTGLLDDEKCLDWLHQECHLDHTSAQNLHRYFRDQRDKAGIVPDDRTILIEHFRDELGDIRVAILSPFGGKLNLPWMLAILSRFREQWGIEPESLHSDAGILFRLTTDDTDEIVRIIRGVNADNVENLLIRELANSSFFGLRFRHNAYRSMFIPRPRPGKRSPLWLQRIRARDLLEISRKFPSFPVVVETYRECLQDYLATEELKVLLSQIESDEVRLVVRRSALPSPFVNSLMFEFMAGYMYQYDAPKLNGSTAEDLDTGMLGQLIHPESISGLLSEEALSEVEQRLQGTTDGYRARTPTELIELMRRIGDLSETEIRQRITGEEQSIINQLVNEKRIIRIPLGHDVRWIIAEDLPLYSDAFSETDTSHESLQRIIERYLWHHSLISTEEILQRYPVEPWRIETILKKLQNRGELFRIEPQQTGDPVRWGFRENIQQIRRVTIRQERKRTQPCDTAQFIEFLLHWQHCQPGTTLSQTDGLLTVLEMFQGLALPAEIWENEIFGRRIIDYRSAAFDELCQRGEIVWYGINGGSGEWGQIAFAFRENIDYFRSTHRASSDEKSETEEHDKIRSALRKSGACFLNDIAMETQLAPSTCAGKLWEMIWRGEVTNDSFAVIRAGKPATPHKLNAGEGVNPKIRWSQRRFSRYHPTLTSGRWSLLKELDPTVENNAGMLIHQLFRRYGLLCREIYEMEQWQFPWQTIYNALTQLEWRGEIRRGYFVKGLSGVQFALPEAADALFHHHRNKDEDSTEPSPILMNSCDPSNLYGAASPLPLLHPLHAEWRLLRHPNNFLIFKNGLPILAIESKGIRLTPLRDLSADELKNAVTLLPQLLNDPANWRRIRSLKVEMWDGTPIRNSHIRPFLLELGFRDEFKALILEKSFS